MGYIKQNKLKLLSFSLIVGLIMLNIILIKQTLIINTSNQEILSTLSNINQAEHNNSAQLKSSTTPQGSISNIKFNGAPTKILSGQPINQMSKNELIALIQKTIQDELYNLDSIAGSQSSAYFSDKNKSNADSNTTNPLLNAAINSTHGIEFDDNISAVTENEMAIVIEGAVSRGIWSIEDNNQLMSASSQLNPEARRRLRGKLMTAINNQELMITKDALITF